MKSKIKIVVIFFLVMLIGLINIYLVKNKDIIYRDITSNSNKYYVSLEEDFYENDEKECKKYNDSYADQNIILEEENGNKIYVVQGCAWDYESVLRSTSHGINDDFKKQVCSAQKEMVTNKYSNIQKYIDNFNNSKCVTNYGYEKLDLYEKSDKNKDIIYKDITSNSNKYYVSLEEDFYKNDAKECEKYNDSYADQNIILEEENGNKIYVVQGCAWDYESVLNSTAHGINDDFKKQVCNAQKEMVTNKYSNIQKYIDDFNNSKCVTNYGYEKLDIKACDYFSKKSSGNYSFDLFNYANGKCVTDANPLNGKTGVLSYKSVQEGYPVYLVQGCAWGLSDIVSSSDNTCVTDKLKEEVCWEQREFAQSTNSHSDISNFNEQCVYKGILDESYKLKQTEYIKVVFKAPNAYGMECDRSSSATGINECTYLIEKDTSVEEQTITINNLPDTDALIQNTTGAKFSGWRRGSDTNCDTSVSLSFTADTDVSEINFEACFKLDDADKEDESYTLYKTCKGDFINEKNIKKTTDVDNTAILTSSLKSTHEYVTTKTAGSEAVGDGEVKFNINSFCKITCTENFNYYYPTIFETVKAGTYFELLSYPEVRSWTTCTETFDYDAWEEYYREKIKEEKKAYVDFLNAEIINRFSGGTPKESSDCGCDKYYSSGGCKQYKNKYTISKEMYYYNESDGSIKTSTDNFSYCENSGVGVAQAAAKTEYRVPLSVHSYGTRHTTAISNREAAEKSNIACFNALYQTESNTNFASDQYPVSETISNKFYEIKNSTVTLFYENGEENIESDNLSKYKSEILTASNIYLKDSLEPDTGKANYSKKNINFEYGNSELPYSSFDARKFENNTFSRTVTRTYVYSHGSDANKYYSKYQSGKIIDHYESNSLELGYVYPVELTLSGNRDIYFGIEVDTNLGYGASTVLGDNPDNISDKNVYKCDYDISNDIIVEDETTSSKDDYKKNFYVRSVSTQDVDPNNRLEMGKFGANWTNAKGMSLIDIIESKSVGKNTYNPNNLEYSFVLDAQTIDAIREYNLDHKYDDFNMECNDMGSECKSNFLTNLASENPNVGGIRVNNVNAIMNRNNWKYYVNGSWYKTSSINNNGYWTDILNSSTVNSGSLLKGCNSVSKKSTYNCLYRKNEGVLP